MSSNLIRSGLLFCLSCCVQLASAQADLSVRVTLAGGVARADQAITAKVYLLNEGTGTRKGSVVHLRMSPGLFYVDYLDKPRSFDEARQEWTVPTLAPGQRDSLEVVVQPNVGGVHVLTAELTKADGPDWDSAPGNGLSHEDDQHEVCLSIPIKVDCGQTAVLRAPSGRKTYIWYRNDTALLYAKSDTLHPQGSGAYRFAVDGETCSAGNCCPVVIERQPCAADVALLLAFGASPRGANNYAMTLTLFNEGSGPVSSTDYYLTTSAYLRLADQAGAKDWQISPDRMRRTYRQVINPGDSARITFELETVPGGTTEDYRVFAEVSAFYSGTKPLDDIDSTPDEDPSNDAVVDGGRRLPRALDEDDSDVALLSNCPLTTVTGAREACAAEAFTLTASTATSAKVAYAWSGNAVFSCRECASPKITLTESTTLTVTTKTAGGCEQRESIRVEVRDCARRIVMVVSPYGKTSECLTATGNATVKWCGGQVPATIKMDNNKAPNGEVCLSAQTTGQWAGVAAPCLEVCEGGSCRPASLQVLALPKKDTVLAPSTGSVCLTNVLQVQSPILSSRLIDNTGPLTLKPTGSNCYEVTRPTEAYAAKTITVIHEYRLLDRSVFDTTLVRIPASNACSFEVLAKAGYEIPATITGQPSLCIAGARTLVTSLTYTLNGQTLATPSQGCDPYKVAKFSLRGLPANYTDDGWRIERYEAAGKLVISNRHAGTLAQAADLIRATDPGAKVSVLPAQNLFEVEDFTQEPTRLRMRHLATNTLLDLKPVIVNGSRGWALQLPAGLSPKRYTLVASNAAGCADTSRVTVVEPSAQKTLRDTLNRDIEVGEPLYLADLEGYTVPAGVTWTQLGTGYVATFAKAETRTLLFSRVTGDQRRERVYVVRAVAYACAPLVASAKLLVNSESCDPQTVPLGLTRPGLQTYATSGTATSLSRATGSRPGAVYSLSQVADRGLTGTYTVASWVGVAKATGSTGSLQAIVAQLRKSGFDIYVDWANNQLIAAGPGIGELVLRTAAQQTLSLQPTQTTLSTYGELYLRVGTSTVSVASASCKATIDAELKCKPRVIIPGGTITIELGDDFVMPLARTKVPTGYALRTDTWKHQDLMARSGPNIWKKEDLMVGYSGDSTALVFSAKRPLPRPIEITFEACGPAGDCVDVVIAVGTAEVSCGLDLWVNGDAERIVPIGTAEASFILPAGFDPETDELSVDGAVVSKVTRVKRPTFRTYPATAAYQALRTPSGKTVHVSNGDVASAARVVFAEASFAASATEVSVDGPDVADRLFGQRADGTWGPVEFLYERTSDAYAVGLTEGNHVVRVTRGANSGSACADSIAIGVTKARVANRRETLELTVGEPRRYCLPAARKDGIVVGVTNDCKGASGELVAVAWEGECLTLQAYEAGEERICVRRTYLDGGVDSITLQLRSTARRELDVVADRDTLEFGQFKVLEVLRNDGLADEPLSLSLVSEPFFGRAQVVGNSAIEYLHYGGDCAKDIFTYEVCQGDVCDSTTVELMVYCDELLIYNGMSPNGDGVNEEFTVLGLGQYPEHQISVFNRSGNLLIEFRDYGNDWRGEVGGRPLDEGTYFYVIDLGNGESRSGYLQLTR